MPFMHTLKTKAATNGTSVVTMATAPLQFSLPGLLFFLAVVCHRQGHLASDDRSPINLPSPYYQDFTDTSFKSK